MDRHAADTGARYERGVSGDRSPNIIGVRALRAHLGVGSESKCKCDSGDLGGFEGEHCASGYGMKYRVRREFICGEAGSLGKSPFDMSAHCT